jgi:hypothetical protein
MLYQWAISSQHFKGSYCPDFQGQAIQTSVEKPATTYPMTQCNTAEDMTV